MNYKPSSENIINQKIVPYIDLLYYKYMGLFFDLLYFHLMVYNS